MKVFVSSKSDNIEGPVDLHFGRAQQFLIIDSESGKILKNIKNENLSNEHGVGIKTAGMVLNLEVDACISGSFGPKAYDVLKEGDIPLYITGEGSIASVMKDFSAGKLESFTRS